MFFFLEDGGGASFYVEQVFTIYEINQSLDFSAASKDLGAVANNEEFLGLPSDDSEDDDFNPDKANTDEEAKEKSSSSDFTSDFDDLGYIKNEETSVEVKEPVIPENDKEIPKTNMEEDDFAPITANRQFLGLGFWIVSYMEDEGGDDNRPDSGWNRVFN